MLYTAGTGAVFRTGSMAGPARPTQLTTCCTSSYVTITHHRHIRLGPLAPGKARLCCLATWHIADKRCVKNSGKRQEAKGIREPETAWGGSCFMLDSRSEKLVPTRRDRDPRRSRE